jgi:energy-coupling factor transporter ATP-binding protein EcfA2
MKLKQIDIKGIRGVKDSISLELNGKSIVLYGDNGMGKSSISDAIEWFYTSKVEHLKGNEIDLKEALRNVTVDDDFVSEVGLIFKGKTDFNTAKTLFNKRGSLDQDFTIKTDEIRDYLVQSKEENLLLRYKSLNDFVDITKGDKLKYLSDIIGFSEVTKKKEVLRKAYASINIEIKRQNFEGLIGSEKKTLIDKIEAVVSKEEDLFKVLKTKIVTLKLKMEVDSMDDIDALLKHLKTATNEKLIKESAFLEKIQTAISGLQAEVVTINSNYDTYYSEFKKIAADVEGIMKIYVAELLKSGTTILNKFHKRDNCPLCLQEKDRNDLLKEIAERLKEAKEAEKKLKVFQDAQELVQTICTERIRRLDNLLSEPLLKMPENEQLKKDIELISKKIKQMQAASKVKAASGDKIEDSNDIAFGVSDFLLLDDINARIKKVKETIKKDNVTEIYSNISASKDAFLKIKLYEKERAILDKQSASLSIIYNEFVKVQKEGLENFIDSFSTKINEYYQYMNPDEPFQEIKIVTMGEEDELNGITIEYKYNGNWVSPPQKYFSESHLNCFGISFFLASVDAFNDINKFIVLDDVISSFDSNHRKRFAELLFEKFNDRQIILLTHEEEWFRNFVKPLAKKKNWLVNEIKWTEDKGTHFEESKGDIKSRIENKLANSDIDGLGNPIRQYLESSLKEICINLDVKVSYRPNEINEKRMPNELINELKSRIKAKKCNGLIDQYPIIDRVASSSILGNLLSHDNPFNPKLGDLKAFWADIQELEKLFYCQEEECTKRAVSFRNLDTVNEEIRCGGCGKTKYDWK